MNKLFLFFLVISLSFTQNISFHPISHGTFIIKFGEITIAIDPVGKKELFDDFLPINMILITDIHGDHASKETVSLISDDNTKIYAPKAVTEKIDMGVILNNGDQVKFKEVIVKGIPMYNLTEERLNFHSKGRGNGYLITLNDKRIYVSGDTEDIPEMRQLKNIDYAFICMNLPYTMTVEQAASATLEMNPGTVIPYHYRGTNGFSDIEKFKSIVNKANNQIAVKFMKWY